MNQPRLSMASSLNFDDFSLAIPDGAWNSADLTSFDVTLPFSSQNPDFNNSNNTISWTSSPHSSPTFLVKAAFDAQFLRELWDNEAPSMSETSTSSNASIPSRKQRRSPPCLDTRRAQNRQAQRAYRQRAALHLKAVEEELATLKQKYGELSQSYDKLNCWSNGLLSALLERNSSWGYDSGSSLASDQKVQQVCSTNNEVQELEFLGSKTLHLTSNV